MVKRKMDNRERLIQHLLDIYEEMANLTLYFTEDEAAIIADVLLAKGVIAPPVKVGDTVYEIVRRRGLRQRKVVEILIAEEPSFVVGGDIYSEERYHFSLFGKTVFLTQEEAEKALKGLT